MMASLSTGSEAYCQGADAMNLAPRQPIGQAVEALMQGDPMLRGDWTAEN